jgi:hypothetical protein
MMPGKLHNKIALITGTANGQGRAGALLFAKEGAKVIGCDLKVQGSRETEQMVKDAGGEMISRAPVDLSIPDSVAELMNVIKDKYGYLDILYNNAGAPHFAPVEEMSLADWSFTIRNELDMTFFTIHYQRCFTICDSGHGRLRSVRPLCRESRDLGFNHSVGTRDGSASDPRQCHFAGSDPNSCYYLRHERSPP